MKKYKMIRVSGETHNLLKGKANEKDTSILKLLDKILKSYYKGKKK